MNTCWATRLCLSVWLKAHHSHRSPGSKMALSSMLILIYMWVWHNNKHCVVWDKDINTLLPTNHTTQHHVPKLWFLPTKLHDVIFPNTGTYQPDYTMSHSQMLVATNQTIWSYFPTTGTYHPDHMVTHSQTFSPTNHSTCCHISLPPPSRLYIVTFRNIFTYQPGCNVKILLYFGCGVDWVMCGFVELTWSSCFALV